MLLYILPHTAGVCNVLVDHWPAAGEKTFQARKIIGSAGGAAVAATGYDKKLNEDIELSTPVKLHWEINS